MNFGEVARKKRIEAGLTLTELAEKVGCSASTISRFERGEDAQFSTVVAIFLEIGEPLSLNGMDGVRISDYRFTINEFNEWLKELRSGDFDMFEGISAYHITCLIGYISKFGFPGGRPFFSVGG